MWLSQRIDLLALFEHQRCISFVGAGGKTSLIEYLASRFSKGGRRVAITTTTKIWVKEPFAIVGRGGLPRDTDDEQVIRIGRSVEKGKLTGLDFGEIEALRQAFDVVLIEADGAKSCPLKFPAPYEPVIPPFSEGVVVVAGLDGLGRAVADAVFRWELLQNTTGLEPETRVDAAVFQRLFREDALMKGVDAGKCVVVLNKYDSCTEQEKVPELARAVSTSTGARATVVASVRDRLFMVYYSDEKSDFLRS